MRHRSRPFTALIFGLLMAVPLIGAPARTASGYRAYGPAHLERLQFIRHCRSLDMPLADVRRMIELSSDPGADCGEVDAMVRAHLSRVRAKLAALRELEAQIAQLGAQCDAGHRLADCGVLRELIHAARGEACACHPGTSASSSA